jgi:hypothetical protein
LAAWGVVQELREGGKPVNGVRRIVHVDNYDRVLKAARRHAKAAIAAAGKALYMDPALAPVLKGAGTLLDDQGGNQEGGSIRCLAETQADKQEVGCGLHVLAILSHPYLPSSYSA